MGLIRLIKRKIGNKYQCKFYRKALKLNLKKDPPDARDYELKAYFPAKAELPTSVSLKEFCPPIENQDKLGACTAFSTTAAFAIFKEEAHE